MSIANFRQELKKSPISRGADWLKADFHIHAPHSSDYEYKQPDAVEALGRTLETSGYKFAVILKHQEFPGRDEIAEIARFCPSVALIPGAEINVIVDALFKKIGKDYFFHCIVAVDPGTDGDYGYVLRKAQEAFTYREGDYPAGFRSSIVDLGNFFRKNGAIFIPAHLHQSKKPENSRSIDDLYDDDSFLGFVADGAFDALEVRDRKTATFFTGSAKTTEGRPIPRAVCVSSSDAHKHTDITDRNRATWLEAEATTFAELSAALSFPHRVRLEQPILDHAQIVGIHIVGSFIKEIWLPFSPGLNALIGSKGSGKTAILESLRFVLNTSIPPERRDDVSRHMDHILGSSGYVECLVKDSGGKHLLFTRRADSRDRIAILNEVGETKTIGASERTGFPISILGWHEIEAVADQPEARISLLDQIGDKEKIEALYLKIKNQIENARDELPILQRQVRKLDSALNELWALKAKRATLTRLEKSALIALQQEYEWHLLAEQKIDGLLNLAKQREGQVGPATAGNISLDLENPPNSERATLVAEVVANVRSAVDRNKAIEAEAADKMRSSLSSLAIDTADAVQKLNEFFRKFRDETYKPKVDSLPPEDREILTKQIQVLEETKKLPLIENQCADLLTEVRLIANRLTAHCEKVITFRNEIATSRTDLVSSLNKELAGVQLTFLRSANANARERFKQQYGNDGANLIGFMQGYGKQDSYENLAEVFRKVALLELDQSKWQIHSSFLDIKLVDLFNVFDDDDVEIRLDVGKNKFVPIQNLSAGQRCVAVFPLLLRNSAGPLVIDQPEDNLDNRYIADIIAPDLLRKKEEQQFLVTSHNANLVVLTDADLIVHVNSDGTTASFPTSGFFACPLSGISRSVLDVLDGGERALAARQQKYGARR